MAPQQLLLTSPPPMSIISQASLAAMTLLFCAFALFMCASHSQKWRHWSACYGSHNQDPVIQLNNEATMHTAGIIYAYQPGDADESMFSGEQRGVPVWQKNILMGGKCELPDFSGVIIYDSEGNVITPAKTSRPLLTWK